MKKLVLVAILMVSVFLSGCAGMGITKESVQGQITVGNVVKVIEGGLWSQRILTDMNDPTQTVCIKESFKPLENDQGYITVTYVSNDCKDVDDTAEVKVIEIKTTTTL